MNPADIDLLARAARAVGFTEFECKPGIGPRARGHSGVAGPFDPLGNNGDCVSVAVKLGLRIAHLERDQFGGLTADSRREIVTAAAGMSPLTPQVRLAARHDTTPEQLHEKLRDFILWMYDHGVEEVHISRIPGTAKIMLTIDGKPA